MSTNTDFNVLFVISDQHKCDITGCYGNDIIDTPAIDSLAARGVLFENAGDALEPERREVGIAPQLPAIRIYAQDMLIDGAAPTESRYPPPVADSI